MNLLLRAAAAAALLLPLAVAPATAQNYRGAWSLYGGGIWFSDLNNDGDTRLLDIDELLFEDVFGIDRDIIIVDDFGFADLTLDAGWIVGTQLEYWFGNGRFGIRANGAYTERPFDLDGGEFFFDGIIDDGIFFFDDADDLTFGDVNVWLIDGDLMIRILRPKRDRTWAPFVSLGAGVAIYNPAGHSPVIIPPANAAIGDFDFVFVDLDDDDIFDDVLLELGDGNRKTKFVTAFGLGTDILPGWRVGSIGLGIRLEVADHIAWDSPAEPLFGGDDFDPVHNVRFTAGILTTFGRLFEEEVVAVAPPPAPPAPPAEEAITVCVIDPNTYEVEYINAVYLPSSGDTLVTVNGQRTPISRAYPETAPLYVSTARWYTAGEPLTVEVNGMETEWVTYGGGRVIDPSDLAFLGTVDGTPVYANVDEVRSILGDLEGARPHELEDRLERMREMREVFDELEVIYVPLSTNCVFQPLRRVEEVRKVRG
ncbi:MAG: hypothetical protein FWJ74_08590 [Gemmatimonadota bacterium]|jgi:hypothetical protein